MTEIQDQFQAPDAIGAVLRNEREQRGETLADVAHALKLSVHQVDALEREDFGVLPGPAFVRGFLRNYARYMQIDLGSRIAEIEFDGSNRGVRLATVSNASGEIPTGGLRSRIGKKPLFGVVAGMVVVLGLGWYFDWFKIDSNSSVVSSAESVAIAPVQDDRKAAMRGNVTPPSFLVLPGSEPVSDPAPTPDDAEIAKSASESTIENDKLSGLDEEAIAESAEGAETVASASEPISSVPAQTAEATSGRLTFKLGAESWIQVRDGDGTALFTGTGSAGTTRVVQGNAPFTIVVGNAGKVELDLDGRRIDMEPHISPGGVARMTIN